MGVSLHPSCVSADALAVYLVRVGSREKKGGGGLPGVYNMSWPLALLLSLACRGPSCCIWARVHYGYWSVSNWVVSVAWWVHLAGVLI